MEAGDLAGVAFTTGPHPDGYSLDRFTARLAALGEDADLVVTLHELADDTYGPDSQPADAARATLTGPAPTSAEFTDLTYTCAGCALAPNTTYFVVAESVGSGVFSWAFTFTSATLSETTVPRQQRLEPGATATTPPTPSPGSPSRTGSTSASTSPPANPPPKGEGTKNQELKTAHCPAFCPAR